jgi:glycosyltransferase involved in cell wall biosynthesis
MSSRYCVIIPAFNAAATIGGLVQHVKAQGLHVVVVDDGSEDRTAAVASEAGALVISHLRNEGKGCALRTGFEHALRARYDGVVTMDSDGQHDPDEIAALIQAGERQHAGMVIGDRMANGAAMPAARHWTNRLMSWIICAVSRQRVPDTQSGFRFIRKELLERVPLRARRYEIETELLFGAARQRWKIVSVPVRSIYREGQPSHIRPLRDALRFIAVVLRHVTGR